MAETPHSLKIPPVMALFARFGRVEIFETDSSLAIFRRLETAAALSHRVEGMNIGGQTLDADSLAALNAYLRTPRALNWNGVLPFARLVAHRSRWAWADFMRYLDFTFA